MNTNITNPVLLRMHDSTSEPSALRNLSQQEVPEILLRPFPLVPILLLIVGGASILFWGYGKHELLLYIYPPGSALILTGLFWAFYVAWDRSVTLRGHCRDLREASSELLRIQSSITAYLTELDTRTRRYFHCVTNTKVVAYFMLRQIEEGLGKLASDLDQTVAHPTPELIIEAHDTLARPFEYRDGFLFNSGNVHQVLLFELKKVVAELTNQLELGISAMEEEIKATKEEFANSNS